MRGKAKKLLVLVLTLSLVATFIAPLPVARGQEENEGEHSKTSAILRAADRLVDVQNNDGGFDWIVDTSKDTVSMTNLLGITAMGILEAWKIDPKSQYATALAKAYKYAKTSTPTYTWNTTKGRYEETTKGVDNAADIAFLIGLAKASEKSPDLLLAIQTCVPGADVYEIKQLAKQRWDDAIKYLGSSQAEAEPEPNGTATSWAEYLINLRTTQGHGISLGIWDIAHGINAALALHEFFPDKGYDDQAQAIAAVIEQNVNSMTATESYYVLGLSAAITSFKKLGLYQDKTTNLVGKLLSNLPGDDNHFVQDKAYSIMALARVETTVSLNAARKTAAWLVLQQQSDGGWLEGASNEYPEVNSEVIQALAALDAPVSIEGKGDYYTIQSAINYASSGDTISINPGTYIEDLTIDKAINLIGVADENGEKPVIKGTGAHNEGTNSVNVKLVAGSSGSVINALKFEALKEEQVKSWTGNNTYYSIMLKDAIKSVSIVGSTFFTDIDRPLEYHAVAIEAEAGSENTLIESCAFDGGYYVTVQGKNNTNGLTVRTSTITNAKSGINVQGGSNITVNDTYIKVIAQASANDTYAVRVGSSYPTTNAKITGGTFIVDKNGIEPAGGTYHSAIITATKAAGNLSITGATIEGEVVNLSTAILDASGNYWGTDEGPFSATLAGPIVIYDWYADEQMTDLVSLDSVATKVPAHGSTGVALNAEVKLVFNYPVEMVSEPSITIGSLSNVSASLADDKKTVVITHPPFAYGTSYTVNVPEGTFYAKIENEKPVPLTALNAVAIEGPTVFNKAFSWTFTTAARPLPPPPPPPPEEPTPPGAEEPLPDSAIEEAISEAEETGEVVLSAPEEEDTLALTLDQLSTIGETEKPVVVNIGEVQIELPTAVVSNLAELTGAQVEIKVAELSSTAAEELHGQATNADQYKLAGTVFEITMELVKYDGSREGITDLGGKVKVYVPVPSDKQELAAAGLLTVARFNENTEAWEEIPSSFDEDTKCMIFETTHFSKYAVLEKVLDTAAPTVVNTDPVDNATNVPIDKVIKVTFNEDVVSATNFDKITLADAKGATVAVTTTLTANVLTITPSDPLAYSTEYTVTIPAGAVKDAAGNPFAKDFSFNFTTKIVPRVVSTDPVDNATNVPIDKVIKVTFNEDVVSATNFDKITLADAKGATVAVTTTVTASVLTITPSNPLAYSTEYTVTIPAGAVKDAADNTLPEDFSFNFTTMAEPDTTAPEVESTDPANGAVDVPPDKVIKVTFTEEVVKGNAFADIVLKNAEGKEISTKVEISDSDLTIRPNARLEYSTKYTVTIPAGAVKDAAGNPLKEAYTFSFTTVGLPTQTFDDIQGHWAQHDIELMAGLGIAKGVGDNKFNPDGNVTRAEFVALLVRSLDVPVEPVSETFFKDVPLDAWFAAEVEAAHKVGIAIGFEDGTFRPYAQVTREQIAAFIVRAMNWTVEEEEVDALLSRFTDQAKISSWAKKEVAAAVQKGIVLGRPDGTFDPQANATRAEAVVMLKRVLQAAGVIPPNV